MKISLNELKNYIKIPAEISDQTLIELIGSRLVEVEEVINLAPKYKGIYIVKVVSAEKIPDTHLTLCQVDAGEKTKDFSSSETVQVVCGAPNVHTGMLAIWIAPGAIVPATYGGENFKLGIRKLRGYESNGMLAAIDELDLGACHTGIAEIDPKTAQPGDDFAAAFDLNDTILDVENKSLTHRPDCFGLIGFAREVAGILGLKFLEPTWPDLELSENLPISVKIIDPKLCPRYSCVVFDLPKNQPSKYLTKSAVFLAKAGMRAIDPMVDLTNILMLRTGQPLHAFDYDKLIAVGETTTPKIVVRAAQDGEKIQLLDGKTITCIPEDILITSNNIPIALAGAMGGKNTEIDASTSRVVLESATFSLYNLRKTQMAHGIFSEAITRFTKGQPAAMTLPILAEAIHRLHVAPLAVVDQYPQKSSENVVNITTLTINRLLGTNYDLKTIQQTLENVGFIVRVLSAKKSTAPAEGTNNTAENIPLEVVVPVWRTDIHIKEDIIEEVGRLLGYDNIPLTLPEKPFTGTKIPPILKLKTQLRSILSDQLQMNELLTYSFVSRQLLEKVGQDPTDSYEITNSISPELQCFRQQIVPSLLDKIRENLKSGHHHFTLYELNQVTAKSHGLTVEDTPILKTDLGIACLGDFYQLKTLVLAMARRGLKLDLSYAGMAPGSQPAQKYPYLEPLHSAELFLNGKSIGAFGEVKAVVLRRFKVDQTVSALELNLDAIVDAPKIPSSQRKFSKFPTVERDLTFRVAADLIFGRVLNALDDCLSQQNLLYAVTPTSIYQANPDDPTKNLSFRLKFSSPTKTLDSREISDIIGLITTKMMNVGAEII